MNKKITVNDINQSTPGGRLKYIRSLLGLKQSEIGESFGISNAAVSEIEKNKTRPSYDLITILKEKYNINLDYFFTGKGDPFIKDKSFSSENMVKTVEQKIIDDFMNCFYHSSIFQLEIIRHFLKYYQSEKEVIEKDIQQFLNEEE
jgi:transcriptional regulator with XRE-family HTH domain